MWSSIVTSPYLNPDRDLASRCGAWVIDSWPPATTISHSPARMSWSASAIAFSPERHTLLMVSAGTSIPMPAATAACRAGIWPAPAVSTWPMITYSTNEAGTLAFSNAPLIAMAPRSLALKSFSEPISLPIGVRAPATITDVVMTTSETGFNSRSTRSGEADLFSPGYRYVMSTDQVDTRRVLSTALVTAVDHVGIAVPDLDVAIAWYHDHLGMIVLHEEVNDDQGIREAMLSVRGAAVGSAQVQLMAPLDDSSAIAKFLDKRGPGIQQLAYRVSDLDALSERLGEQVIRLLYDAPRRGTAHSRINFIHPKDAGGVLIELVEPAEDSDSAH